MSSKIFNEYAGAIKNYCVENCLDFGKLLKSPYCYGKEDLIFLYSDPNECGIIVQGDKWIIDDSKLMPATLEIYLENGRLRFVQTDITRKYLGVDREAARPPAAKRPAVRRLPSRELAPA